MNINRTHNLNPSTTWEHPTHVIHMYASTVLERRTVIFPTKRKGTLPVGEQESVKSH